MNLLAEICTGFRRDLNIIISSYSYERREKLFRVQKGEKRPELDREKEREREQYKHINGTLMNSIVKNPLFSSLLVELVLVVP